MVKKSGCNDCELCKNTLTPRISGIGPKDAKIFIIGDAPNFTESKINSYGQGNSHRLLSQLLNDTGVDIKECYYTPVVKCPKGDNGKISAQAMKACKKYLEEELSIIKPEWVIALGANPLKSLTRTTKITEVHGTVIKHKEGFKLFPALHPAMSLRDQRHWEAIQFDFRMFGKHLSGEDKVEHNLKYVWVKKKISLPKIIARIKKGEDFSFDLETNGLNMRLKTSEISVSVIGFMDKVYVLDHQALGQITMSKFWKKLSDICIDYDYEIATANGKFDQLWLYFSYGVRMNNTFDVNLAAHLLDENSPNGLKINARVALEMENWDVDVLVKKGQVSTPAQKKKQIKYAAWDGYATLRLMNLRKKQLKEDNALWNLFKWETMPASNAYFTMETNGVVIHQERFNEAEKKLKLRIRQSLRKLSRYTTNKDINWNSPDQLNEVLFEELKLKATAKTPSGDPSTAEDALKKMSKQHPIVDILLEYRGYFKQLSGFIEGWKVKMIDGRIWPNFKIAGTVTGRPSCAEPNLQQVPRDPFIRSLVTAPPGYIFFEADYSQAELRIAAAVSGEPTMLRTYRNGGDIHISTYVAVIGMTPEEAVSHIVGDQERKTQLKEERKKAKAVNFGFIYGMGWRKFKQYAESTYGLILTDKESQAMRTRYFEVYAGLIKWHERQRKIVKAAKQVRTLSGRIRHLPQIDSPDDSIAHQAERLAINSPVQGFGAELGLMAISEIEDYFNNDIVKLVGTIHDAIVGYVKLEHVVPALRRIQVIMESPAVMRRMNIEFPLPIVADISIGDWSIGIEMGNDVRSVEPITIKKGKVISDKSLYLKYHEPDAKFGKYHTTKDWHEAESLLRDKDSNWIFTTAEDYFNNDIPF